VICYAGSDSGSVVSDEDLASGDGPASERALVQCTTTTTAADARAESDSAGSGDAAESGDPAASTLAEPLPEYLVCRREADYGVLTLDPGARIDPIAACAAIGMEPAG